MDYIIIKLMRFLLSSPELVRMRFKFLRMIGPRVFIQALKKKYKFTKKSYIAVGVYVSLMGAVLVWCLNNGEAGLLLLIIITTITAATILSGLLIVLLTGGGRILLDPFHYLEKLPGDIQTAKIADMFLFLAKEANTRYSKKKTDGTSYTIQDQDYETIAEVNIIQLTHEGKIISLWDTTELIEYFGLLCDRVVYFRKHFTSKYQPLALTVEATAEDVKFGETHDIGLHHMVFYVKNQVPRERWVELNTCPVEWIESML